MKIGILGTRGIPNHHGGFEQFAEYFSVFASENGHDVYVYNSHNHPYKNNEYKGVNIVHCYDLEKKIGTAGQFLYDLNCILDSRSRGFDVLLQLGYTSSSIWGRLLPQNTLVITNMDGLEWKRSKYSKTVQSFLKYAEKLAVKTSNFLIADSVGIKKYLKKKYNKYSEYIPYGADVYRPSEENTFSYSDFYTNDFFLLIARIEPENNIEMILDGYVKSKSIYPFCVVGNVDATPFGVYLRSKYINNDNIRFVGAIYDLDLLNSLRHNARLYFHGHSVGGTNPSLLEAMACGALIAANKNDFNQAILGENSFYFSSVDEVVEAINIYQKENHKDSIEENILKIKNEFNWPYINNSYLNFFKKCLDELP